MAAIPNQEKRIKDCLELDGDLASKKPVAISLWCFDLRSENACDDCLQAIHKAEETKRSWSFRYDKMKSKKGFRLIAATANTFHRKELETVMRALSKAAIKGGGFFDGTEYKLTGDPEDYFGD